MGTRNMADDKLSHVRTRAHTHVRERQVANQRKLAPEAREGVNILNMEKVLKVQLKSKPQKKKKKSKHHHNLGYLFYWFFFWLHWVFIAAHGLSLVVASGGYSSLQCAGFSLWGLLLSRSTGSRHAGFSSCGAQAQ